MLPSWGRSPNVNIIGTIFRFEFSVGLKRVSNGCYQRPKSALECGAQAPPSWRYGDRNTEVAINSLSKRRQAAALQRRLRRHCYFTFKNLLPTLPAAGSKTTILRTSFGTLRGTVAAKGMPQRLTSA